MLLLIDIGNTTTTVGLYDNRIKDVLRLRTGIDGRGKEEYKYILKGFIKHNQMEKPEGAVICSVVPHIEDTLVRVLKRSFNIKPLIVNHRVKSGLRFSLKNPEKLGADRIATAAGAHKLYKGNLIVVDFGTATTFCVITSGGEYRGGAIMPGLGISAEALAAKTARLPRVELELPRRVIGKDTEENILTGVILGHAGGSEKIIKEMAREAGMNPSVVATGGLAYLVVPYMKVVKHVNPFLTLEGLRIIYELNRRI